jgi:DNA-directed RNA polymerase specialized sigma54-like protein
MNSKVSRVIETYSLDGLGDELVERWVDDGESLRSLADEFNRRVLASAMQEAGLNPINGEVENTYRLLTGDDVSSGIRTEARRSLERDDVRVETVLGDFVSHQAVHTYLTKHRGVSKETEPEDDREKLEKNQRTIQQLKGRTRAVATNIIENLRDTGRLDIDDFDVMVDVRVIETASGETYDVSELFETRAADSEE